MKYLDVVFNIPLEMSFAYFWEPDESKKNSFEPEIGKRVEAPFGSAKKTGLIVGTHDTLPEDCAVDESKIRRVKRVVDDEPVLSAELLDLARWMADYYLCSVGESVFAMIPSGRRETGGAGFSFSDEMPEKRALRLSVEQAAAVDGIFAPHSRKAIYHYLYGPTGSGKTEVFLSAAERMLSQGKGVIYLVPEIALAPQVARAVSRRFGRAAAVLHSGLTAGQRFSEWRRIIRREARVVVGARSAAFAPVPDLGLVIIDEEHDASYKSSSAPRYHARQVAMRRCQSLGVPLVMGSATPSVEAWHFARTGRFIMHTLSRRLAGGETPSVSRVDLSTAPMASACFSRALVDETRRALGEKKQAIFFLNRRGFTHFFRCASCGWEMECKNCSAPMTYHKSDNRLRCHYCGWSAPPPQSCPKCSSIDIGCSGFGTEFVEAESRALFPNARVIRIDADAIEKRGDLEEKIGRFRDGEFDILLGTQMIAKGLNFPNLALVGIMLADTSLHIPDFRASERTFALITQVAGRAGRFFPGGKVIVQTYRPLDKSIRFAAEGDAKGFYEYECAMRESSGFPPFSRMARLVFRSTSDKAARAAAEGAARMAREIASSEKFARGAEVMGPAECPILKIARNYRHQLLLRAADGGVVRKMARSILSRLERGRSVYVECDMDPVSMM